MTNQHTDSANNRTCAAPPIIAIQGGKGGVGKSMLAFAVIDALQQRGAKVLLVETDTANPDVWRALKADTDADVKGIAAEIDHADGWIDIVDAANSHPEHVIVINSAARTSEGVKRHGETLNEALAELDRELRTLWVINRQRDSLDQLVQYLETFPDSVTHVVRNEHWGDAGKFTLYNESELRTQLESAGGLSLSLPDLADRVADALYSGRLTIARGLRELPLGNRAELSRWRRSAHRNIAPVL